MIVTVTPAQAQHVAALLTAANEAQQRVIQAVTLLSLGQVPEGTPFVSVNTDDATLLFHVEHEAPDAG